MAISTLLKSKTLYVLMLCMSLCLGACKEDVPIEEPKPLFDKSLLIGEWRATTVETQSPDGGIVVTTDLDNNYENLWDMAWFEATEDHIRLMNYEHVVLHSYDLVNSCIILKDWDINYELESITSDEMKVKCTGDSVALTTYKRVVREPINGSVLLGEWIATKIDKRGDEITDEATIKGELEGLYRVVMSEEALTMVSTNVTYPYTLRGGYLDITLPNKQLSAVVESAVKDGIVVNCAGILILYEPLQKSSQIISGVAEKGPFVSGSTVDIEVLAADLSGAGKVYNTEVDDNLGGYHYECSEPIDAFVELKAHGYFFNEVQGSLSGGALTLRSLVGVNGNARVNINVLTHLKAARIKKLVSSGLDFSAASERAQREVLGIFGLGSVVKRSVEAISMADGTADAAALIATSALLLMNRSEAELTSYLADITSHFGNSGTLSDDVEAQLVLDKAELAKMLAGVEQNVIGKYASLGKTVTVKELRHYVDWDGDGVAGNEVLKDGESVRVDPSVIDVPNEGGSYAVHIDSPIAIYLALQTADDSENDTVHIVPGVPDGDTRVWAQRSSNGAVVNYDCELDGDTLYIDVQPLESAVDATAVIALCDYVGNEVATIELRQAAKAQHARIEFAAHYINNATRAIGASYDGVDKIPCFTVYGGQRDKDGNMTIFEGADIVNSGDGLWNYAYVDEELYWAPQSVYNFSAVVNATSVVMDESSGVIDEICFTTDGATDLLYATESVTTYDDVSHQERVSFEFSHLLSKVVVKVKNNVGNSAITCKVSNIRFVGVNADGVYAPSSVAWEYVGDKTIDVEFGNASSQDCDNAPAEHIGYGDTLASNYSRMLIPGTQHFTITYDYALCYGEATSYEGSVSLNVNNITLKAGCSYVFGFVIDQDMSSPDLTVTMLDSYHEIEIEEY